MAMRVRPESREPLLGLWYPRSGPALALTDYTDEAPEISPRTGRTHTDEDPDVSPRTGRTHTDGRAAESLGKGLRMFVIAIRRSCPCESVLSVATILATSARLTHRRQGRWFCPCESGAVRGDKSGRLGGENTPRPDSWSHSAMLPGRPG
jgi:hypothetical protein